MTTIWAQALNLIDASGWGTGGVYTGRAGGCCVGGAIAEVVTGSRFNLYAEPDEYPALTDALTRFADHVGMPSVIDYGGELCSFEPSSRVFNWNDGIAEELGISLPAAKGVDDVRRVLMELDAKDAGN